VQIKLGKDIIKAKSEEEKILSEKYVNAGWKQQPGIRKIL
jgi:hypothetical protein